jgi:hypothetical protein
MDMKNETTNAVRTNEEKANQVAAEMEKAHAAAINVAALQQSQWYQDRKALLVALRS